jgi:DNA-binding MarR family transcriptional regulator
MQKRDPVAQKLLEAFMQFHRLKKQSPVEGLTHSEFRVLFWLRRQVKPESPGIKVSDISGFLRVATPTITQQINSLENSGLVERSMDREDRRAIRVKLTDAGEKAVAKSSEAFFSSVAGLVEHLGEEKSRQLAELLSEVFTYFNEVRKPKP